MYTANIRGRGASKVTVPEIRSRKTNGQKISMVTAYDFTMARLVDEAGVDMILVGDSLGMVVQGLSNTIPVTLEEICYHGRAVMRGVERSHVVEHEIVVVGFSDARRVADGHRRAFFRAREHDEHERAAGQSEAARGARLDRHVGHCGTCSETSIEVEPPVSVTCRSSVHAPWLLRTSMATR